MTVVTDMGPRTVNIFWQTPLYFIITVGECLFSITGLSFAYTQVLHTILAYISTMFTAIA